MTRLPQEAEAMGLNCAINWLIELGIQSIIIVLDCLSVMKLWV